MQKNGAGLHTASSCFWDNTTDGKLEQFSAMQFINDFNCIICYFTDSEIISCAVHMKW